MRFVGWYLGYVVTVSLVTLVILNRWSRHRRRAPDSTEVQS